MGTPPGTPPPPRPRAPDPFSGGDDGAHAGAPIGGIGAGSIGRTYRGDFARWQAPRAPRPPPGAAHLLRRARRRRRHGPLLPPGARVRGRRPRPGGRRPRPGRSPRSSRRSSAPNPPAGRLGGRVQGAVPPRVVRVRRSIPLGRRRKKKKRGGRARRRVEVAAGRLRRRPRAPGAGAVLPDAPGAVPRREPPRGRLPLRRRAHGLPVRRRRRGRRAPSLRPPLVSESARERRRRAPGHEPPEGSMARQPPRRRRRRRRTPSRGRRGRSARARVVREARVFSADGGFEERDGSRRGRKHDARRPVNPRSAPSGRSLARRVRDRGGGFARRRRHRSNGVRRGERGGPRRRLGRVRVPREARGGFFRLLGGEGLLVLVLVLVLLLGSRDGGGGGVRVVRAPPRRAALGDVRARVGPPRGDVPGGARRDARETLRDGAQTEARRISAGNLGEARDERSERRATEGPAARRVRARPRGGGDRARGEWEAAISRWQTPYAESARRSVRGEGGERTKARTTPGRRRTRTERFGRFGRGRRTRARTP